MNAYKEKVKEIKDKIDANNKARGKVSYSVSQSDLVEITQALMNSPDHEVEVYAYNSSEKDPEVASVKKPSEKYRNSLKGVVSKFGVDKNDTQKMDEILFDKEHARSMIDIVTTAQHDYLRAGRKFTFPLTEKDETRMEIMCVKQPERKSVGNRFNKNANDDSVTITKERTSLKAKNTVPYWLKSKE